MYNPEAQSAAAADWASGLYMVNVKWNGKEMTKRLVIEK
jgi:hypothetical protein